MRKLIVTLFLISGARAATLSFTPAAVSVLPGDTVFLDVMISGLGGSVVGDFDLDVGFNPAALTLAGFVPGNSLGVISIGEALDFSLGLTAPGSLNIAVVSTLPAASLAAIQTGPFSLATLEFTVGALSGSTLVQISSVNALGDGVGFPLPVDALETATITGPTGPVVVPEPGSWMLALAGLGAGLWRARGKTPHP